MKQIVRVTRRTTQTLDIEVDVPESELIGKIPAGVSEAFNQAAEDAAGDHDFGGTEDDADYEGDYGDATPMNINWVAKAQADGHGLMVVGSLAPEGTLGTVESWPPNAKGAKAANERLASHCRGENKT